MGSPSKPWEEKFVEKKPGTIYPLNPKHGGWMRAPAIPRSLAVCGQPKDLNIVIRPKEQVAEIIQKLYDEAETKREERSKPPPNMHPQGGISFVFDPAGNRYNTVRKSAKRISKDDMTDILLNQNVIGFTKKQELMQKLYNKYRPDLKISVEALEKAPTREAK